MRERLFISLFFISLSLSLCLSLSLFVSLCISPVISLFVTLGSPLVLSCPRDQSLLISLTRMCARVRGRRGGFLTFPTPSSLSLLSSLLRAQWNSFLIRFFSPSSSLCFFSLFFSLCPSPFLSPSHPLLLFFLSCRDEFLFNRA